MHTRVVVVVVGGKGGLGWDIKNYCKTAVLIMITVITA